MLGKLFAQSVQKPLNCPSGQVDSFNPDAANRPRECVTALPDVPLTSSNLKLVLGIVFGVAAGVALISLLIAAVNFATAATDTDKIARSKKTIVFSLIGLIIALSAEVIVLTLLGKL